VEGASIRLNASPAMAMVSESHVHQ